MSGTIILLISLIGALLSLQSITATVRATSNSFHAEIDCFAVTLILDNNKEKSGQKRKFKKNKKRRHRLSALLCLPPSLNFLLTRSKISINSIEVPTRTTAPHEFFTRFSLLHSAASLIISFLFSKSKEVTITDGALNFSQKAAFPFAFSIDFTMVFTLYNLILFGLIFLFESIKRRIKNARKQNE